MRRHHQLAGLASAIVAWIAAVVPGAAAADPRFDALAALTTCPKYDVVSRTNSWTPEEEAQALDGIFDISETPHGLATLTPPIDWAQDPFSSDSWRGDLASLKWTDLLFHIYRQTPDGEPERLEALIAARDIILDWIDRNPPPAPYGLGVYTDNKPWGPKVAGDRVPYIAYLARALACEDPGTPDDLLNEVDGMKLLGSIASHVAFLSDPAEARENNQGLFMDVGLVLVDDYFDDDAVPGAAAGGNLGRTRFPTTLLGRTTFEEGIWLEHSSGYQRLAANLLRDYLEFTNSTDPVLTALLGRMQDAAGWFVMPDGTMPQFGDSYRKDSPDWTKQAAADDTGMRVFRESGYVIVKRPDTGSFLAITAGFHNLTHKHADDTSFDLFEHGHAVVSDTGLFHKDDGGFRAFEQEAQAHSVLTEGREDFNLKEKNIYGSGVQATGTGRGWYAIQVANPVLLADKIKERRLFLYKPGVALLVMDTVQAQQKEQFRRWFHIGPDIAVSQGQTALGLNTPAMAGRLQDSDRTGRTKTFNASSNPFQGYVFPSFREARPRTTVLFQSKRTQAMSNVAAFSLGGPQYRAADAGGKKPTFEVRIAKRKPMYLEVRRSGIGLTVSRVEKPPAPRERRPRKKHRPNNNNDRNGR